MRYAPAMFLAVLAAGLLVTAQANAFSLQLEDGTANPQPYTSWLAAAKAPQPVGGATIHTGACPPPVDNREACSSPGDIWLNLALYASLDLSQNVHFDFMHEMGHQFDYTVMTDPARLAFEQLLGDTRPWRSSPESPHEKFAEAWAGCALHRPPRHRYEGAYGYRPTRKIFIRVCALLKATAANAVPAG